MTIISQINMCQNTMGIRQIIFTSHKAIKDDNNIFKAMMQRCDQLLRAAVSGWEIESLVDLVDDVENFYDNPEKYIKDLEMAKTRESIDAKKAVPHKTGYIQEMQNHRSEYFETVGPSEKIEISITPGSINLLNETYKELIRVTLNLCDFNRTATAKMLGISIRTLRNRMKEFSEE